MSTKPDPQKAIHLQPNQRRLPGEQRPKPQPSAWEPHQGDQALDAWGVALRDLKEQGHSF